MVTSSLVPKWVIVERKLSWPPGAILIWCVIDSSLSVATGFGLNKVPNTGLLIAHLIRVLASGALKTAP